jgi:hypothetical protein
VNIHEELQSLLDELGKELQQAKAQVGEERKNVYDLQTQLEVCTLCSLTSTMVLLVNLLYKWNGYS